MSLADRGATITHTIRLSDTDSGPRRQWHAQTHKGDQLLGEENVHYTHAHMFVRDRWCIDHAHISNPAHGRPRCMPRAKNTYVYDILDTNGAPYLSQRSLKSIK